MCRNLRHFHLIIVDWVKICLHLKKKIVYEKEFKKCNKIWLIVLQFFGIQKEILYIYIFYTRQTYVLIYEGGVFYYDWIKVTSFFFFLIVCLTIYERDCAELRRCIGHIIAILFKLHRRTPRLKCPVVLLMWNKLDLSCQKGKTLPVQMTSFSEQIIIRSIH